MSRVFLIIWLFISACTSEPSSPDAGRLDAVPGYLCSPTESCPDGFACFALDRSPDAGPAYRCEECAVNRWDDLPHCDGSTWHGERQVP